MITLTPLNNPEGAIQQEYSSSQEALIPVVDSTSEFNPVTDQVIFSVETVTGELLQSGKVSNFTIRNYENTSDEDQISSVVVFPIRDLQNSGYNIGVYNVYYNFYRVALESDNYKYFIQEISPSRTELRLSVNNVSNEEINSLVEKFKSTLEGNAFKDFYINVNGSYYIANNITIDETSVPSTILIKLYQPLPSSILVNSQLQIVLETAETVGYSLNLPPKPITVEEDIVYLKGPNFNYQISDQINNSTELKNYDSLVEVSQFSSSYNELENILNEKGININIDYTEFNNFVQYSSAEQRLENFYYKVGLIEGYNNDLNSVNNITGSTSSSLQISASRATYEAQITDVIKNFDGYENYLYYTSGTLAYPKSNNTQPYTLQSTGSTEVLNWLGSKDESSSFYGGRIFSASQYDDENQDNLINTIPDYLRNDPDNSGYELFLNMIGQHFDVVYSYINTITERYNGDNRLDYGISKDLVADALKGAGLKLYQNNFSSDDLYASLLGINGSGSLLPPTGSEVIETYISASDIAFPLDNVNKGTYKRLYHNLPYLLKKKGTVEGLRALINCFGIPDTILRISEFGGKDKNNSNDWDYFQSKFNYGLTGTNVTLASIGLNSAFDGGLNDVLFRFKYISGALPPNGGTLLVGTIGGNSLNLEYTGGGLVSASYSGSIISQSVYEGAFQIGSNELTASFFNGEWWTIGVGKTKLRTGTKIYDGNDGFKIGFNSSSIGPTVTYGSAMSLKGDNSKFAFQELRLYSKATTDTQFNDFVMNPLSIEGNSFDSSKDELAFRAPLGADLSIDNNALSTNYTSIHPAVTGSYITQSFSANSNYTFTGGAVTYVSNSEFIYYDQPAVGIKNRISEKIRSKNLSLPEVGDTLSAYRSIQQNYPHSASSYTKDINYVEVAFSPQNEINDDINSTFGYLNIGEYIGDPRQFNSSSYSYPDLNELRDSYFEKYYKNYNWKDYIRLIKYFDNSLFKMVQDFVPASSGLASGVVIKQHLLERNKQRPPQVETSQHDYSASIESGFISGGTGGVLDNLNVLGSSPEGQSEGFVNKTLPFVTQSWVYDVDTPQGPFVLTQSSQEEFYDGEFSGSEFTATTGELNDENTNKKASVLEINYDVFFFSSSTTPLPPFQSAFQGPLQGELYLWYDTGSFLDTGEGSSPQEQVQQQTNNFTPG